MPDITTLITAPITPPRTDTTPRAAQSGTGAWQVTTSARHRPPGRGGTAILTALLQKERNGVDT